MDVTFLDIFLWVLSFIAFVFFLIFLLGIFFSMLDGEVDAVPFFILGAISLGCFAAGLSVIGLVDAENRVKDSVAHQDFVSAGYTYWYVSRRHAKLPIGSCVFEFDVKKIDGKYRPVADSRNGGDVVIITPEFQETTTCPS